MADHWYFDCAPCGIAEPFDTEDQAIRAAEDHVFANHRDVRPEVRGAEKIGHVQNRSDNAFGTAPQDSQAGSGSERYGASRPDYFDAE